METKMKGNTEKQRKINYGEKQREKERERER